MTVLNILPNEYWYGGVVDEGVKMPLSSGSNVTIDLETNTYVNQINTVFLSSKGRVIGSTEGFILTVEDGVLKTNKDVTVKEATEQTLKAAYQVAMETFFPFDGKAPPMEFFTTAQFNTWIEFIYNQRQESILSYARAILDNGYEPGILMIDDGWSDYYGKWDFNKEKFPDAKAMVDQLHEMGFKVMVWICPFITPDTLEYRILSQKGAFVQNADGSDAIRKWWNGYSAVLDGSDPEVISYLDSVTSFLMNEYGIDGFKFDAGDPYFYREDDQTHGSVSPNEQCRLWSEYGEKFPYNEFRISFNSGGKALVQRLADKDHAWGNKGVAALIPNSLAQGILGYPYACPDMIGGGEYANFLENSDRLDQELFVRYTQIASLMPMMQFSAAPWRVLSKENADYCYKGYETRRELASYIESLVEHTTKTGEPIIRYLAYEFPNEEFEEETNQFMLGSDYLVAPVTQQGSTEKSVRLPNGTWEYVSGEVYEGGQTVTIQTTLADLPYFKKQ